MRNQDSKTKPRQCCKPYKKYNELEFELEIIVIAHGLNTLF